MTVGVFDDAIATAQELIAEFGEVCDWHKSVVTPDDPDKPWLGGTDVPIVKQPSICFLPASDAAASGFGLVKMRQGDDVPRFSTYGLMGAVDFIPEVTDKLLRSGVPQVIVAVDTLKPNEQVVLYILSIA